MVPMLNEYKKELYKKLKLEETINLLCSELFVVGAGRVRRGVVLECLAVASGSNITNEFALLVGKAMERYGARKTRIRGYNYYYNVDWKYKERLSQE